MRYQNVYIDSLAYELPSIVVTTAELEGRLTALYQSLRMPMGQLESITGIHERRWWPEGVSLADGATLAAKKALIKAGMTGHDIDALIYAGVCRDYFEPATACQVAAQIGVSDQTMVYDISNACLGVLNGIIDIANRIELGQIRAGLVVSCESARDINENTIDKLLKSKDMELFKTSIATLTGGSGAAAVLLTNGSFNTAHPRRLLGGVNQCDVSRHDLCRWGIKKLQNTLFEQFASTDAVSVFKHGLALGVKTWQLFLKELGWKRINIDKIISHQVGKAHRESILKGLGYSQDVNIDFPTFPFLGNMGTVSLPLSAALAEERGFLKRGEKVGLLGIGSGLNCLMMGVEW
jgi:3-oxoacyl-[acyl-carrier-protein] synthase-3